MTPYWIKVGVAAGVTFVARALPAFVPGIRKLEDYPRLRRILDLTICFITGDVIYSTAFLYLSASISDLWLGCLSIVTLVVAIIASLLTRSLLISFGVAIGFFVGGLLLCGLF